MASDCVNKEADCNSWASSGYCTDSTYGEFMADNCKKACGLCGGGSTGGGGSGCTDKIPDMCPQWKSEGLCDQASWKTYMDEHCAKTCGRSC